MSDEFIPILTYQSPETPERNAKGLGDVIFGDPDRTVDPSKTVGRVEAPAQIIEDQMTNLLKSFGGVLSKAKQRAGELAGMELDEIEISVGINGRGEVSLMGIGGAQAGANGAITLKFKRKESE